MGEKRACAFRDAGVLNVFDLLRFAPKRYEDRRSVMPLASLRGDETLQGVFRGKLEQVKVAWPRRNLAIVWALFRDASGEARARWFNQAYLARSLKPGAEYFLFGKGAKNGSIAFLDNPEWEDAAEPILAPFPERLTPVYRPGKTLTDARITHKWLRKLIASVLSEMNWDASFPHEQASSVFDRLQEAICRLHWPPDLEAARRSAEAMAFLDMVLFQMAVLRRREQFGASLTIETPPPEPLESPWALPYPLTDDQKHCLAEIVRDMIGSTSSGRQVREQSVHSFAGKFGSITHRFGRPMNRLLQGEVGSGKTVVAFLAMRILVERLQPGSQVAFMAPTEILARQHERSFLRFFPECSTRTAFLGGSLSTGEKQLVHRQLRDGTVSYVFGTHALFQEGCVIPGLRLAVIDEQQRFGVEHRRALMRRGGGDGDGMNGPGSVPPHLLMISATPIPRTLALTAFGDLEVSVISHLPPGRLPVTTHLYNTWKETLDEIRSCVHAGQQVYYICPRIEKTEKSDWGAVRDAETRLRQAMPEMRVVSLTGQDAATEREETLREFGTGAIDILVATTIVEVGMDFPNATVLVIENAERFGLSQLHQLRGRIGRGRHGGKCLIVSDVADENERLQIFCSTVDGFAIAAADLRFRGPGDLVGTCQSGLNHPALAHLDNPERILQARERARQILQQEPETVRTWFYDRMRASFGDSWQKFMEGG